MRAVQPGPVPSGPRVALLPPPLPVLLLLLLVVAPASAQAQAPAPDLAALCRWVSRVAGAGQGDTQTPAPPRPRGKVARVVAAAPQGDARGPAAVALTHGAPCLATCGCHKSGGFVRLPRPGLPPPRKLQGAEHRLGFCPTARTFSLKFQPRGFGDVPSGVHSPGSASPRDGFGVGLWWFQIDPVYGTSPFSLFKVAVCQWVMLFLLLMGVRGGQLGWLSRLYPSVLPSQLPVWLLAHMMSLSPEWIILVVFCSGNQGCIISSLLEVCWCWTQTCGPRELPIPGVREGPPLYSSG